MKQSTEPFQVVRVADPAIDKSDESGTDWMAFFADRDPSRLRYHVGAKPMVFHCRVLTQPERREVKNLQVGGESTYESRERAFAYGLIRVERYIREDGGTQEWQRSDVGAKAKALGDAGLAQFGTTTIDEIGGVVEARSFLDRDQQLLCPLLPTSALAFRASARLHAELTSQSADRSDRSRPPPEAPPLASQTPSPDGVASGDATATANPI